MIRSLRLLSLLLLAFPAVAQIPAFPGAQGYGAYATGGRGGDVYYVTTLNNSGAGSLRNGLDTAPAAGRTIVFAVSGYIPVVSDTDFDVPSKVTIAGQTAPGDGVGLRGGRMLISGSNVVMRHFRIRHGKYGTGGDCLNIASSASITMLDHISMMFSTDENFSFFNSSVNNFTLQYSNSTWGMERHNAGGLWDLQNGSCHHTLWAHHRTRNPKARPGMLEWINNVTFHWRIEGFIMGDSQTPASWKANVRGCYYISIDDADEEDMLQDTALTKATVATNGVPNFSLYLDNTLFDNNANGVADGINQGYGIVSGSEFVAGDAVGANRYYKSATPFAGATGTATVTVDDPTRAYKKVISSGSPLRLDANYTGTLRDELDTLLMDSVVNQYSILVQKDGHVSGEDPARTSNGEQLLADQYGITNNGFGTLNGTTPPTDVDLDGMPDFWELTLNGVSGIAYNVATDDHNTAFTAGQLASTFFPAGTPTGYTYLEEYLHFLAVPHATVLENTAGTPTMQTVDLRKFTSAFSQSPAFALTDVLNGTAQQFLADGTTPSATGPIVKFTPTLNFSGRAGFNFTVTDAQGSQWTQQFALLVTATANPRGLIWIGNGGTNTWDGTAANWQTASGTATAFSIGDTALFDDRGSATPALSLSGTQSPGSVLVTGSKNYTFGGTGSIASTGALTKAGDTTLTLAASTSFAAGTFLNGGETILAPAGNLAGGTIRFTGGSTLTSQHTSDDSNTLDLLPNLEVASGAVGNINLSQRVNVKGSLSGGGTFNIFSPSNLEVQGQVYLDGASAGCTGTVNLSGGATAPGNGGRIAFRKNGASFNGFDNARLNLSGIDLFTTNNSDAEGAGSYAIGALSGDANSRLRCAYVGGKTTWSIGSLNIDTTFAGEIMDGISAITIVSKYGTRTLTLTGANSYSGATTVNAGTLRVNGSLGATATTVASGATLAGAFSTGGLVTLATGSTCTPGASAGQAGTVQITAGGIDVAGATMKFDLSSNPSSGNDRITLTGGTMTVRTPAATFDFNLTDGYLGAGTYLLIDGPTSATSAPGSPSLTHNLPASTRQAFSLQRSGGSSTSNAYVRLLVTGTAGDLIWTGSTSTWDIANTTPWNDGPGGDNRFLNLDAVTFDDDAANRTVTLSAALQPRLVTVDHSGSAYTFGGTGSLTGSGRLVKDGTGTLSIANTAANTFTGGTTLKAGTLSLTNTSTPLGAGTVTINGGTLQLPTAISLPNSIVFSGNSAIATSGGNSAIISSTSSTLSSSSVASIDLSGVTTILSINGSMSGFSGTLAFGGSSGMLRLNSNGSGANDVNFGSSAAHFDLGTAGATLNNRNGAITIHLGAVSGGPNTHLNGRQTGSGATATTYVVGALNTSTTFSGNISNAGDLDGLTIVKTGTGNWTLAGSSNFTGSFSVAAGTLTITGSTTASGNATLATGATLTLTGGTFGAEEIINNGDLSGYGTLNADLTTGGTATGRGFATGTPGTLAINGLVAFGSSSVLRMRGGVSSDLITAAGDVSLGGTIQVSLAPGTTFGRYPLITTSGGTITGTALLTGIPGGISAHLSTTVAGRLDLVIDDTDEDALPDSWEQSNFGTLSNAPNDDTDDDGQSNASELLTGTHPNDGSSHFAASITPTGSQCTLAWPSVPGKTYDIETTTTLDGTWSPLISIHAAASPATTTSHVLTPAGGRRFYRIVLRP